jgi:SAM-dependent methyltransferase
MTTTTQLGTAQAVADGGIEHPISLLCWQCGEPLGLLTAVTASGYGMWSCNNCGAETPCDAGIWRSVAPLRIEYFKRFVADYEFIRSAEGRGSVDDDYYLALPYKDLSGKNADQWKIRASTFRYMRRHVISPLAALINRPLRILDLGAGNGWMSYRLALLGHSPIAVDLLTNDYDGLGAAIHFSQKLEPLFPRVQAELDDLPFDSSTFDLAIFNASFHYSENYDRTLAEALRCIHLEGAVVIADSPWYADEQSGRRMVDEKHRHFAAKYGFASNSIDNCEYLTPDRLSQLQSNLGLQWKTYKPFYGFQWLLRPLHAKLRNRRPPSHFRIYTAQVKK